MTTHLTEDELVLHYYGEMSRTEEPRAVSHLAGCRACQDQYSELLRVLAVVDAAPGPEIPEGFERTVWARLEPTLPVKREWLRWMVLSPARLAWGAAVVTLVTASFYAGRHSQPQPAAVPAPGTVQTASQIRERILLVDLGDHLDRSQMMLVEIVSADGDGTTNISSERDRAVQLVAANRLYRQTAAATGDRSVTALLDELERVLVDIAASPDQLSPGDLDGVRQRIDTEGLLFKVRVTATQIRERQKHNDVRVRAGQSS